MKQQRPSRDTLRTVVIYAAAFVLAAALVHRYYKLGGPYFEFPKTVQDHVAPSFYPSRDVILLAGAAAEIIPRGATVTAIQPSQAPDYDVTLYLTAAGMMPRHRVVPPHFRRLIHFLNTFSRCASRSRILAIVSSARLRKVASTR